MRKISFIIKDGKLMEVPSKSLGQYSRNEVYACFTLDREWADLSPITAQFENGENCYDAILDENNECQVPWEVLRNEGILYVTLYGGDLLVSEPAKVRIYAAGRIGANVPTKASPGVYQYIVERAEQTEADWKNCKELIENYKDSVKAENLTLDSRIAEVDKRLASIKSLSDNAGSNIEEISSLYDSINLDINSFKTYYIEKLQALEDAKSNYIGDIKDAADKGLSDINYAAQSMADGIIVEKEGVVITGNDCGSKLLKSLELTGAETSADSISVYVCGKNILDSPFTEENPLTFTSTKDEQSFYSYDGVKYSCYLIEGVTYTFSVKTVNEYSTEAVFYLAKTVDGNKFEYLNGMCHRTFVCSNSGEYQFLTIVKKVGVNIKVWDIQVEISDFVTDFTPGICKKYDIPIDNGLMKNDTIKYENGIFVKYSGDNTSILSDTGIHTLKGITNIFTNTEGYLKAEYIADTKLYIDSKLG